MVKNIFCLFLFTVIACHPIHKKEKILGENTIQSNIITLMKKEIDINSCKVLFDEEITKEKLTTDWIQKHSDWSIENGWLVGKNKGNWPGMAILKADFPGNVMIEFEAKTILPCTHDINFMWNGSWNDSTNQRDLAYIAGLQGWWTGKVGIEKSPKYEFMCGTPLLDFEPGKTYKIIGGSIEGHCFIIADGKLLLEVMDPNPIDHQKYTKVGFEAYSSQIAIRNVKIRQINWVEKIRKYESEF